VAGTPFLALGGADADISKAYVTRIPPFSAGGLPRGTEILNRAMKE
jgi:hypothetical protein